MLQYILNANDYDLPFWVGKIFMNKLKIVLIVLDFISDTIRRINSVVSI